jgi:hypothetical protein
MSVNVANPRNTEIHEQIRLIHASKTVFAGVW